MTENKPNADWLSAFTLFPLGDRALATRNAINEQAAALRELFICQTQSGCDGLVSIAGKLSEATSPAERMNVLSSIVTESSRTQLANLTSWAQLYFRNYADFVGSFAGSRS